MTEQPQTHASIKSRVVHELKSYLVISAYLFVCFVVILMYEASLVPGKEATLLDHGMALGKALVIGKFILIGEALDTGTRVNAPTLLHRVAFRCVGMMVVLLVLKLIEELIIGLVHGESAGSVISGIVGEPWLNLLAPALMMLLILIPLITATELDRALGQGKLKSVLMGESGD